MFKKLLSLVLMAVIIAGIFTNTANFVCAKSFRNNVEVESLVDRLYNVILDREPDEYELDYWYDSLVKRRNTAADFIFAIFEDDYYISLKKDNACFVNDLYRALFDREGAADEVAYFKVRLDAGISREYIIKDMIETVEFTNFCMDCSIERGSILEQLSVESYYNSHNYIVRLYNVALDRNPDYEGMLDWQKKLVNKDVTGAEAAYEFIFSDECVAKTVADEDFIKMLYKVMLDREADDDGIDTWVAALNAGNTREQLFAGFVNSQEFTDLCSDYGIARGNYLIGREIDPSKPMIALTFDDGPAEGTMRILEMLEQYNQAATFFVVGSNAKYYQDTLKKMEEIGCEIGNHTYNHPNLTNCAVATILEEISSTNEYIFNAVGHNATLIRPPYGAYNDIVKENVSVPLILWSVDTRDWATKSTTSTVNSVLTDAKDGSIVLMHDIHESTVDAACILIPELVDQGYELVTVSELAFYKGIELEPGGAYYSIK